MSSVYASLAVRGVDSETGAGNEKLNAELGGETVLMVDVVACIHERAFSMRGSSSSSASSPSESASESSYSFKRGNGAPRGGGEAGSGKDAASSSVSSSNVVVPRAALAKMSN